MVNCMGEGEYYDYEIDGYEIRWVEPHYDENGHKTGEVYKKIFLDGDTVRVQESVKYRTHSGFGTYEVITNYITDYDPEKYMKRIEKIKELMENTGDDEELDVYEETESLVEDVLGSIYDEDDLVDIAVDVARNVINETYGVDISESDIDYGVQYEYYGPTYVEGTCHIEKGGKDMTIKFSVTIASFKEILGNQVTTYYIPSEDDVEIEEIEETEDDSTDEI